MFKLGWHRGVVVPGLNPLSNSILNLAPFFLIQIKIIKIYKLFIFTLSTEALEKLLMIILLDILATYIP